MRLKSELFHIKGWRCNKSTTKLYISVLIHWEKFPTESIRVCDKLMVSEFLNICHRGVVTQSVSENVVAVSEDAVIPCDLIYR